MKHWTQQGRGGNNGNRGRGGRGGGGRYNNGGRGRSDGNANGGNGAQMAMVVPRVDEEITTITIKGIPHMEGEVSTTGVVAEVDLMAIVTIVEDMAIRP